MHCRFCLPLLTAIVVHWSCGEKPAPCACPIPDYYDEATGVIKDNNRKQQNITLDPKIKAVINQQVKAELSAGLKMENIYENVNETYWKVKNTNPNINSAFRLYKAIACSYYEVICQDQSMSEAEKTAQKNNIIRLFEANLEKIRPSDESPNPSTGAVDTDSDQPGQHNNTTKEPGNTPAEKAPSTYFNPNIKADVAIIVAGNDPGRNSGFTISQIFKKKKLQTTNTLFHSTFRQEQLSNIQSGNLTFFEHYNLRENVKCICVIEPQIDVKPASFQGESYLEAEGNYQIDIIQLENMQTNSFSIHCKGAGISNSAAIETLEEKLAIKFSEKFNDFSSCKL